jgi:hypothetical protein
VVFGAGFLAGDGGFFDAGFFGAGFGFAADAGALDAGRFLPEPKKP